MRNLVEQIRNLYEIRLSHDKPSSNIDIEKTINYDNPVDRDKYETTDDVYHGGHRSVSYRTKLGTYTGYHDGTGHHDITWRPNGFHHLSSKLHHNIDGGGQIEHARHLNALHNHYIANHVSNYDTMAVEKQRPSMGDKEDEKLMNFAGKHKDFHKPTDTEQEGNEDKHVARTTFIPHPKTGKPTATSDSNDYKINAHSNSIGRQNLLKSRYEQENPSQTALDVNRKSGMMQRLLGAIKKK